jgi:hypothetical protein
MHQGGLLGKRQLATLDEHDFAAHLRQQRVHSLGRNLRRWLRSAAECQQWLLWIQTRGSLDCPQAGRQAGCLPRPH